ncbi:MAG: tetratricopeptide repeat protein, partial [Wenzhouxiangella sp.]|nr:tetratricopeptide repeat protein [Wenzhouxiangella sp.]
IPGAIRALERADQRQPDDPETIGILANCLLITNQGDRALPLIQRLQMIDPFTPLTACLPGWKLLLDGSFEEAIPYYRRMHELDPDNPMGLVFLTWILVLSGELAQARDLFDTLDPGERDPSTLDPVSRISRFVAAAATDRTDAADWLDESIDALAHASDVFPRLLADGFARLGDTEHALHWIDQAIDRGFAHLPYLAERDPMLESLRGLPAFEERLDRLRNLS